MAVSMRLAAERFSFFALSLIRAIRLISKYSEYIFFAICFPPEKNILPFICNVNMLLLNIRLDLPHRFANEAEIC